MKMVCMEMKLALNIFIIVGILLVLAAAATIVVLIYRYITGMRARGFFGGKRQNEEE